MCRPASFVLTRESIFSGSKSESHEDIILEHGLHADGVRGPNIVRVEITPPVDDFRIPLDQWVYKLDQDELPPWYDAEEAEARVRKVLPDWLAAKVVLPNQELEECTGHLVAVYGKIQRVCGGATIQRVCGATIQDVYGSATIKRVYGSATIQDVCDSATIRYVCDSATIQRVYGSATIQDVCGNATIWYVCGSATIQRVCGATIRYVCDSATIQEVCGNATIQDVYGNATIREVYDSATVIAYKQLPDIALSDRAVLIDRGGDVITMRVANQK